MHNSQFMVTKQTEFLKDLGNINKKQSDLIFLNLSLLAFFS